jgi:putative component of toxin-antitoxin plasmid stabilization module
MSVANDEKLPLAERMERALLVLAYFIELDGDVHLPMYEKFEAEVKELKARQDVKSRAHHLPRPRNGEYSAVSRKSPPLGEAIGAGEEVYWSGRRASFSCITYRKSMRYRQAPSRVGRNVGRFVARKIFHIFFVRRSKIPAFSKQVWGD